MKIITSCLRSRISLFTILNIQKKFSKIIQYISQKRKRAIFKGIKNRDKRSSEKLFLCFYPTRFPTKNSLIYYLYTCVYIISIKIQDKAVVVTEQQLITSMFFTITFSSSLKFPQQRSSARRMIFDQFLPATTISVSSAQQITWASALNLPSFIWVNNR